MLQILAACLTLPIELFSAVSYPINPTFLLAPLIAFAAASQWRSRAFQLFLFAAACGLASILIGNRLDPDGLLWRHCLSLVLVLFAVSFALLGRWAGERYDFASVVRWLAVFSSFFGIVLALRVIFLGQAFRVQIEPEGFASLNAIFFGWPVAYAFGVLSLAQLLLIQAAICLAPIFDRSASVATRIFCTAGFGFLALLVLKSEARSAQIGLLLLLLSVAWGVWRYRPTRRWFVAGAALLVAVGTFGIKGRAIERLSETTNLIVHGGVTSAFEQGSTPVETASNGRVPLIKAAVADISQNLWIGTGFGKFSRFSGAPVTESIKQSSSTHVYLLTLIWKGGIVFAFPMLGLFVLLTRDVWRRDDLLANPDAFFALAAVALACAMSFTWDILIVPSAGSLAFFLLGLLSRHSRDSDVASYSKL